MNPIFRPQCVCMLWMFKFSARLFQDCEVPHHNGSGNNLARLRGCTKRGRCEREVGLRQHRFNDSRHLLQTGQPVQTCLEVQNSRFHASTVEHCVRIMKNLNAPDSPSTAGSAK
ncbi:hypothetical protein T08_7790 [Trichinella sp. T8]|nr:hypothetical protein T08_7790 [Trichinella sp. T8]